MKVTSVKITLIESQNLKAFASVCFDESFIVNGVRIVSRGDDLIAIMPSKKSKSGQYHDYAYAISDELRAEIKENVVKAYNQAKENMDAEVVEADEDDLAEAENVEE